MPTTMTWTWMEGGWNESPPEAPSAGVVLERFVVYVVQARPRIRK